MLFLLKNYTLAPAFRLNASIIPIATRHFLTTSPNHTPADPAQAQKTGDKPKRIWKKDITPPFKRPNSSFVAFTLQRAKEVNATSKTPVPYMDTMRESAAAWKNLSDAEKNSYCAPPEAFKEYKASLDKWYKGLSDEALRVIKLRRRRRKGTGFALFISETFKEAKGNSMGEKIADRATVWKSFSTEKQDEYRKRAAETLFGVRAKRAAQRDREIARKAQKKIKAAERLRMITEKNKAMKKEKREREKREKEKEREKKEREKERAKKLKKAEQMKVKAKQTPVKGKKAGTGKQQTTKVKAKVKAKAKA